MALLKQHAQGQEPLVGAGPKGEFERRMLPHLAASFNLACWLLRNFQDAEDAVQDAYLRAFRAWGKFEDNNAKAWILKIVYNCCQSRLRQAGRDRQNVINLKSAIETDPLAGHSVGGGNLPVQPDAELIKKNESRELYRAVMKLPQDQREVIVLREYEDLSYRQIADLAGIPIGTVMSRLARARRKLSETLAAKKTEGLGNAL